MMKAPPAPGKPPRRALRRLLPIAARFLPALPLLRLAWGLARADPAILTLHPVEGLIDALGWWALACLALSLAMAPLQRFAPGPPWAALKRPLGLWAFAYGCLHLLAIAGLDQGFDPAGLAQVFARRPYAWAGLATWLALLPLAATSTKGWQRRLGRNWKRLHRLAYGAAALGVIHFAWKAHAHLRDAGVLGLGGAVAALLLLRIPAPRRKAARAQ